MSVTIDGLVSGIDTEAIVSGLLEIQQTQLDRISLRRQEIQREQTAFKTLEARLLTLRSSSGQLARSRNNPLTQHTVTVSDESAVAASTTSAATAGTHRITVNQLARAHQVATAGFADADSEITTGTLELRRGAGDITTITVDASNNTLSGLAESINNSDAGITATVVKDANGGATPYRLLLTSGDVGEDNAITITNNLANGGGSAEKPEFDLNNPVQAASNAVVTVGSGANAITVESTTNTFDNLINGIQFEALQEDPSKEITLTIAQDTEGGLEAIESFVDSFNAALEFIDDQSTFDSASGQGGIFLGNRTAINVQNQLRNSITSVVAGLPSSANRLSAIGITVNDAGRLVLNRTELEDILAGRNDEVSADDVQRLFALDGESTSSAVSFVLGTTRTQAGTVNVDITQAATRASLTADSNLSNNTVINSANRELSIVVDGEAATVQLDEGTYTRQELADHLEEVLNASGDLAAQSVRVALSSNALQITSESYGNTSAVRVTGGSAVTDLGFTAGAAAAGTDVAGKFLVDGVEEEATGSGQILSGSSDNELTADLQVAVRLDPSQIVAGSEADLTITRGIAGSLDAILGDLLDVEDGSLAAIDERFDGQIESIQSSFDRQQAVFDEQRESLISQFVALERSISELQSTSSFLGQQLANLGSFGPSRSG